MFETILGISSLASLAYGIYRGENPPSQPDIPSPRPPVNSELYDEFGNLVAINRFDAERNTYVSVRNPEPERPTQPQKRNIGDISTENNYGAGPQPRESDYSRAGLPMTDYQRNLYETAVGNWKRKYQQGKKLFDENAVSSDAQTKYDEELADWQKRHDEWQNLRNQAIQEREERRVEDNLRSQMRMDVLHEIDAPPADRIAAYENYAKTFSDALHADVDKRFGEIDRQREENNEKLGMTYSRSDVDTKKEMVYEKARQDVDIAQKSQLAKEGLREADRTYKLNLLNLLDTGMRADTAQRLQRIQNENILGQQGANAINATLMNAYGYDVQNRMNQYQTNMALNAAASSRSLGTSVGLAYLYGYQKRPLADKGNIYEDYNIPTGERQGERRIG